MSIKNKQKILDSVKEICNFATNTELLADEIWDISYKILEYAGVSRSAVIEEIPLCCNNQVGIRFSIGRWDARTNNVLFDLYAGISTKNSTIFFLDLYIENDFDTFPVASDDDVGIMLLSVKERIENGKIVD